MSSITSSPCKTDVDHGANWYSPKLLLRFPDEKEMAKWPQDEFIVLEDEDSSEESIISLPNSPIPFNLQVEGVDRPYPDGRWEFEYFLGHIIDGDRIRLRTIWANGDRTDTVASNFVENLDVVESYIVDDYNDNPTRKIGATERNLWFEELGMDLDEIRARALTEEIDERTILPLFTLNAFDAPEYFKTPVRELTKDDDEKEMHVEKKEGRVPVRPTIGYRTPRVHHDVVPGRELAMTPKVRAKTMRRAGDLNERVNNVD